MIKSAEYIEFEQGFLKEAEAQGCDVDFLKGLIAEADDVQEKWAVTLAELEKDSGDPLFRMKLAGDLVSLINYRRMKVAGDEVQGPPNWDESAPGVPTEGDWTANHGVMDFLRNTVGKNLGVGDTAAGAIAGGGGGGLLGLILGQLLGNPMLGAILGGIGGAGIGALYSSGKLHEMLAEHGADPAAADKIKQTAEQASAQTGGATDKPQGGAAQQPGQAPQGSPAAATPTPGAAPAPAQPQPAPAAQPQPTPAAHPTQPAPAAQPPQAQGATATKLMSAPVTGATPKTPAFGHQDGHPAVTTNAVPPVPKPAVGAPPPPMNVPKPPVAGMIKPGEWDVKLASFSQKIAAGIMEGMAFSNSAPTGPTTPSSGPVFGQPATTSSNPLLPIGAPMVVPTNQAYVTPGGATMTNKRPVRQIF